MSIQFVRVLASAAIGNIVFSLSNTGSPTYSFVSNPGSLFALNGNLVSVNAILSVGTTAIIVQDGDGTQITITFDVTSVAPVWVPGQRPFSLTSPANLPLQSGTNYWPMLMPASTGFNYFTGIKYYLDYPSPTQTNIATLDILNAGWGNPAGDFSIIMTPGFNGVELLLNNGDNDNEAISFSYIGNRLTSFYSLQYTGTPEAPNAADRADCGILTDTGFGVLNPFLGAGVVAAGSSLMLGCLLKEEFTLYGAFNHWVGFSMIQSLVNNGSPNFYPPAISGDGNSGNGLFCEGQLMAIAPGVSRPAGLSSYGIAMFNAMQTYGAWCFDKGGSCTPYLARVFDATASEFSAPTSWTDADIGLLIEDTNILFPLLTKTGYLLDGYLTLISVYAACSPQIQLLRYVGNMMLVTRDSDSGQGNIGSVGPPTGLLNSASISSFCAGTTGRVSTYYNQIGNASFISGGTNAPIIYQSGALEAMNGIPAVLFDGSTNYLKAALSSTVYPAGMVYLNAVIQVADAAANYAIFGSDASGGLELRLNATTGFLQLMTNTGTVIGTSPFSFAFNSPATIEVLYVPGASYSMSINTIVVAAGITSVSAAAGNILIGQGGPTSTDFFKGLISAWTVANAMPSNPQYSISNGLAQFWAPLATLSTITYARDTFTDTNGVNLPSHTMNVGSGWTNQLNAHEIESNSAVPTSLTLGAFSTTPGAANGHITCTLTPFNNSGTSFVPGLMFRFTDTSNFFYVLVASQNGSTNTVQLRSVIAGASTTLANISVPVVSGTGYVIDVYLNGSSIGVSVNGTNLTTVSNSFNETATLAGLVSSPINSPPTRCAYDDFIFASQ